MLTYKDLLLTGPEAVCVLNSELEIIQCNQLADLLLGYRNKGLMGQHLSCILYDDKLISHLPTSDSESGWSQGECILRTSHDLPLTVKFRAARVVNSNLMSGQYQSSDDLAQEYVLVFREMDDEQHSDYTRRLESLRSLLGVFSERNMEPEDMLQRFIKTFDRHAEAVLLPANFNEDRGYREKSDLPLSETATEAALNSLWKRITILHRDENLWCFFPVYSPGQVYGVACVKFAVPRHYGEEDKEIFDLAGIVLGTYMESSTLESPKASSQSLLHTILESVSLPIIVVDRKGAITSCNLAAQNLYDYAESDMIGRFLGDLAFPVDGSMGVERAARSLYEELMNQVMQGKPVCDQEMTHIRRDQSTVDVCVTAYPYILDDGLIVGAIFIVSDLTEKRRLLNKIVRRENLATLGNLLSSVANELNNHLTPLTGYCQLILNQENAKEVNTMVSSIYESAERCVNTIRGVLDLARDCENTSEDSDVNAMIMAAVDLKYQQLESENINVYVKLGDNIPGVVADPRDLERLFLRIINYAEQRMKGYESEGHLIVESAYEDGKVIVRFSDTGACVTTSHRAEIMDPFCAASEENGGIELGLSISYQLLRSIGGDLRISDQMEKGNLLVVELPVLDITSPDEVKLVEEISTSTPVVGKRIMVVDDEPSIIEMLSHSIKQMGHIADVAEDGQQAMQMLDTEKYDLIITDLRMPCGFTGEKLHEFIKRKDRELARRMIFVTGDVVNPETRKFLESTGNPYLEKPFPLESLRTVIEKLLSKSGG